MTYKEVLDRLAKATTPKELRAIHKDLRKFGTGIPFHRRYPNYALVVSCIAFGASVLFPIIRTAIEEWIKFRS